MTCLYHGCRETVKHIHYQASPESPVIVVYDEVKDKAKTDDADKLPLSWLPWAALEAVSRVQAFGHKKYKDFNNYRKGMEVTRNSSCALRHITEYLKGNTIDPESGEHHLAHAICRLAFILQNEADGTAIDDRYRKP